MSLEEIISRQADALERIANALEKGIGVSSATGSGGRGDRHRRPNHNDPDALLRIRSKFADQANSWEDFARKLGDKRQPSITSDTVAEACGMGKSRIYKALLSPHHTDLVSWETGEWLGRNTEPRA